MLLLRGMSYSSNTCKYTAYGGGDAREDVLVVVCGSEMEEEAFVLGVVGVLVAGITMGIDFFCWGCCCCTRILSAFFCK